MAGIAFYVDKHLHSNTIATRKHLLTKFVDIRQKNLKLQQELEELIATHDAWGTNAFTDTDTNFIDYLETLKEKIEIEYSDIEYIKLKKLSLTKDIISEYIEKFKYHNDVLIALRQELNQQKDRLHVCTFSEVKFS